MSKAVDFQAIDQSVEKYGRKESSIIAILQSIDEQYRYLPAEIFPYLSKKLGMSEARIFSVATFYENFSLVPKGKYIIKICDGTACHVRKSIPVLERFHRDTATSYNKHTSDDMMFTVETVSCIGACGLAPVISVNEKIYATMTPESTSELVKKLKEEAANDETE